jgi:hypothetical protein
VASAFFNSLLEHFITEANYTKAVEAIIEFWNHLAAAEKICV